MKRFPMRLLFSFLLLFTFRLGLAETIPAPSEFLGLQIGADRVLADYKQIARYFQKLDEVSPRVKVVPLGKTTLGEEMLMAVISSEENIKNLKRLKEISRRLSDPRGLSDSEITTLAREGRTFLLITCNIHASEIASTQMAMEWAHALATANDSETKKRLSNAVLLLVPSLNPDGQLMETEWYRKYLGTPFEGGRMPWLYHHYVGHDNNRDYVFLTQKESQALNRAIYKEWFPQIYLDEHQMGANGPRIFVPPYAEPVDPDIHPLIWREVNLIGANMALRLEEAGKAGVISGYAFDAYWIGGTKNTAWWKNVAGLLTEVASVRLASPVEFPESELSGGGRKGLIDYGPQANFPNPWRGGVWRLRDIMDYERIASDAILEICSERREDILRNMVRRARQAIAAAGPKEGYRIPADQPDRGSVRFLARLLDEHGVEMKVAKNGDIYVPLAQPYGKFVREIFEDQRYPEVRLVPGREIVSPYDVSAWTVPLMLGVTVEKAQVPPDTSKYDARPDHASSVPSAAEAKILALSGRSPESAKIVNAVLLAGGKVSRAGRAVTLGGREWNEGTFFLDPGASRDSRPIASDLGLDLVPVAGMPPAAAVSAVNLPRIGIYKPWLASMDEGWLRFVLEKYGFAPKNLDNKTIRAGKLLESFDVIVLPDVDKDVVSSGKPKREEGEMRYFPEFPPEYAGGLEKEGAAALKQFVRDGGTLIALASSSEYVMTEFELPVRNALSKVSKQDFLCPGSLLSVRVQGGHPLTLGVPPEVAAMVEEPLVFQTALPGADVERKVLAAFAPDARDVLLSGFLTGGDRLAKKAALVALTYEKGRVVLFSFRPHYRGQTHSTFPLLFNALWWAGRTVDGRAERGASVEKRSVRGSSAWTGRSIRAEE